MKNQNELENELRSSTRRYLCYKHEGAKALIRLSNTIQQIQETGLITETRILEIIDEVLSEPPDFKDPQNLAATIAVNLMKFQHVAKTKITAIEIDSKTYVDSEYPSWSVNILLDNINDGSTSLP